jgi:hypothetical protein
MQMQNSATTWMALAQPSPFSSDLDLDLKAGVRGRIALADPQAIGGQELRRSHRTRPTHSQQSPRPPPCRPAAQSMPLPDQSFVSWCTGVGGREAQPTSSRLGQIQPSASETPSNLSLLSLSPLFYPHPHSTALIVPDVASSLLVSLSLSLSLFLS